MWGLVVLIGFVFLSGCASVNIKGGGSNVPPDKPKLVSPETVKMSPETLARIRPTIQEYLDREVIAGAVTLVARQGKIVHLDAMGYRDAGDQAPMKTDTIFRIYSMTKPIASVALMILYDEGHFKLDDPISKWLPEFSDPKVAVKLVKNENGEEVLQTVPAVRPITFRHVLTHTAGLSNSYMGKLTRKVFRKASRKRSREETVGDFVKRYAAVPLNYHPGDQWQYSRATCVVGRLVEVISGRNLDRFMRERIFKPLKMTDTSFYLPMEKLPRFAANYTPGPGKKITLMDPASRYSGFVRKPHVYYSGSGGLLSTANDYFRFCQMMLNKGELGGSRILKKETVELMTRSHTGNLNLWLAPGASFGLGFAINPVDSETSGAAGTYSWGGAAYTKFWIDPKREMISILMTQVLANTHLTLHTRFSTLANQALLGTSSPASQVKGLGTEFNYEMNPKFTINFPKGTTRAKPTSPLQVFAAKTPNGVTIQATVMEKPAGIKLEDYAVKAYLPGLESTGIALKAKVTANTEFILKDGTKAYRAEVQWIFKPMKVRLMTQMMTAYRGDKLVSIAAHPWTDPEEVVPIIESLRFGPVLSSFKEADSPYKKTRQVHKSHPQVFENTTYEYKKTPAFSFRFPDDSTKAQLNSPGQVLAGKTPEGVPFGVAVNQVPLGLDLSEVGPDYYAAYLEKNGVGSDIKILKNQEIRLKCGTRAYLTEFDWFFQGNRLITTQLVSAFKENKWVYASVHPLQFPWETTAIVKSLNFCER